MTQTARTRKSSHYTQCPPPRNFRPAGRCRGVKLELAAPAFTRLRRKSKGAKATGMQYERKGQAMMLELFPERYVPSPWLSFFTDGMRALQYCQPDGLLFNWERGLITIIEFKLKHTSDAWWQTRYLYTPIVAKLFGDEAWEYSVVEIVRWFDPDTKFPETFSMLEHVSNTTPGGFGVHIWSS